MAVSPLKQKGDLVSFSILVDGKEIPASMHPSEVEVRKEINKIPTATVKIIDGSPHDVNFEKSEEGFKPGQKIKITAGYHQEEETIFEGIIASHASSVPDQSLSELQLKCVDVAASMTKEKKNRYFPDSTDSDAMTKVLGDHDVEPSVESTSFVHERMIQFDSSDWDFLVTRAEMNGFVVIVDDGKVTVKKPETSNDVLTLTHGTDIAKVELDVDTRFQYSKVTAEGWDHSGNEIKQAVASEPEVPSMGNLSGTEMSGVVKGNDFRMHTSAPIDPAELKIWADAKLMRSRYSLIRGKIKFMGHAAPKPDTTVEVKGMGARFQGSAYVSGVYHRLKDSTWDTEVTIGMSAQMFSETQKDIGSPPAGGQLPGVHGLQIGTVQKIDADPMGEMRIQVDIPVIAASGDGVWARQTTYYATKDAGNFFMPEIGDEVVCGFLNGDPRFPIIVGSVYSKKHPTAYEADGPNTYKALTTNSKMKIEFEDVKRIITIWTPNNNQIIISDDEQSITIEDETKNKIVMSPTGIDMYTPKDFTVKADGLVSIEAGSTMALKATQAFTAEGLSVETKASSSNTMKGATAEVNGSATTTIKGGVVMIN